MNNFYTLIQYEYKKIFQVKFNRILLAVVLLFSALVPSLNAYGGYFYSYEVGNLSKSEALKMDKAIMSQNEGYLTEETLKQVVSLAQEGLADPTHFIYNAQGKEVLGPEAQQKFVLPYRYAQKFLNNFYEDTFNLTGIDKPVQYLGEEDLEGFYENYKNRLFENINAYTDMTAGEKQKHWEMIQQIETPFYNVYADGWLAVRNMLPTIGLLILLAITIIVGNIFNKEYVSSMDALILASKHGKSQAVLAKFVTAISFAALLTTLLFLLYVGIYLLILGFEGYNLPIQLMPGFEYCTYPITLGQFTGISFVVFLFVSMSFASFCALVSAYSKNTVSGISILFLTTLLPMFIPQTDYRPVTQLKDLLFVRALNHSPIFSEYFYTFGEVSFTPYVFYMITSVIGCMIFLPFAYREFKNHQVG